MADDPQPPTDPPLSALSPATKKRSKRHSWAQAAPPKTTWATTLSNAIRRALSMADEASALIPAVRADIQFVDKDGQSMGDNFLLQGHLLSKNGVFITDFHQVKQDAMDHFNMEETDDDYSTITIQLKCPNPTEAGCYLQLFGQKDMEESVSVFQAALKFRRPQITRKQIKASAEVMASYSSGQCQYTDMECALHQVWELSLLSTNHKKLCAPKVKIVEMVLDTLRSIAGLQRVNTLHVEAAAVVWSLAFRPDGRSRLLKSQVRAASKINKYFLNVLLFFSFLTDDPTALLTFFPFFLFILFFSHSNSTTS